LSTGALSEPIQNIDPNQNASVALAFSLLYDHSHTSGSGRDGLDEANLADISENEVAAALSLQNTIPGQEGHWQLPLNDEDEFKQKIFDTCYGAFAMFSILRTSQIWDRDSDPPGGWDHTQAEKRLNRVRKAGKEWFKPISEPGRIEGVHRERDNSISTKLRYWDLFYRVPILVFIGADTERDAVLDRAFITRENMVDDPREIQLHIFTQMFAMGMEPSAFLP
jgi:hypothetical protein